jgi:hypothetical protein
MWTVTVARAGTEANTRVSRGRARKVHAPLDDHAPFVANAIGLHLGPYHSPSGRRNGQGEPNDDAVQEIEEDDSDDGHHIYGQIPILHCGFDVRWLQQLHADDDEQTCECRGGNLFDQTRERKGKQEDPEAMHDRRGAGFRARLDIGCAADDYTGDRKAADGSRHNV